MLGKRFGQGIALAIALCSLGAWSTAARADQFSLAEARAIDARQGPPGIVYTKARPFCGLGWQAKSAGARLQASLGVGAYWTRRPKAALRSSPETLHNLDRAGARHRGVSDRVISAYGRDVRAGAALRLSVAF